MDEEGINLVIEKVRGLGNTVVISTEAAKRINVKSFDMVKIHPPNQDIDADIPVRVTDGVYPFLVQIDPAMLEALKIKSLNVTLSRSAYKAPPTPPAGFPYGTPTPSPVHAPPTPVPPSPPSNLQFPSPAARSTPAPAAPAEAARWVLVPNQVDEHQQLVVDSQGKPMYGLDGDGYPLDSRGNSFTAANYYDLWAGSVPAAPAPTVPARAAPPAQAAQPARAAPANVIPTTRALPAQAAPPARAAPAIVIPTTRAIPARAAPAAPAVEPPIAAPQRMQTVAPNQVDKYGVQITDALGNPIFGMDESGWYAIDSAGNPCTDTQWIEVDVQQKIAGPGFNAVLIIDISRSMLARDLDVSNVEATVRSIKRAMPSPKIQYFLSQFKEGTAVPRRMGAALATISFLAEKMSQGPGDKVAVIRFADMAETLDFDGAAFMGGENNAQEMLVNTAVSIVEKIGNSYGQATEMGKALYLAMELIKLMGEMEAAAGHEPKPVMCVLLTDGYPTDEEYFKNAVEAAKNIPNLTLNIIGLGSPDRELLELMRRAAEDCGGEFLMPAGTGQLLAWYAEKAARFKPRKRLPPKTDM